MANPHAEVFDPSPPPTPKSHPWGKAPATEWNYDQYVFYLCFFYLLFVRTHKVWYKNLLNWHAGNRYLMIFNLLTSSKAHQFDPRMKILLSFCSACHPWFDMLHEHVWKKNNRQQRRRMQVKSAMLYRIVHYLVAIPVTPFLIPVRTSREEEEEQNENPIWYVLYLSFVRTHTKFGIKIFEIDFVIEIKWYLTFWPHPKVTSLTLGWKFYCILFCSSSPSIWYATWPCLKKTFCFYPPGHHHLPKVPPLGCDSGDRMKIPPDMFCIFHLWEHTQILA